ncbi:DMT family transporter [Alteribacillus bidgolensis]|uniref:Putative multidrug resistance efflux transporter n=1 Tax=Alteribacillus bidgolensis TaxID=930129 RepID=A0A1G8KX77_9BACI|nr:multidrug resistance efflux transporter family protein [Alteribacillus bidgolensis]SDI48011.1 Putative multidrug resistance efflux transporter [Alteribacillus bidgolensis]
MKEIFIGIIASMFFAVTFILNRSMELSGGSWVWSSSLRFLFMLPFLFLIVLFRHNLKQVIQEMKKQPIQWFWWSFVGFVLFYAPLTYAASYGPGWLVAGTWQTTIVAGVLISPLFFNNVKIPIRALCISFIILSGVAIIQMQSANTLAVKDIIIGIMPVLIAAFAYPLGNRKMMEVCGGRLDTFQRVLGMTLATLPVWFIICIFGFIKSGGPSTDQIFQAFIVAICSGVIATSLFFIATDSVRKHQSKLAAVEATQSTQVLFVVIGEVLLLSVPLPNATASVGLIVIITGMLLHSYYAKKIKTKQKKPAA